ncbi:hypothetical protein CCUS01_07132 [Colletotrichum cuscutae]|uniref:Tyrosinase copper-binding domain-containing protein n=1 Tax=Colletotrichum cuscutae TaxID=1209917 RepID=A0AAI9UZB0_9PEZI|nr:hypothetical protein CCUS01_07132 [Colletotrichum cuscutae]
MLCGAPQDVAVSLFLTGTKRRVHGTSVPNPLFSYKLQEDVHDLDNEGNDKSNGYTKLRGYDSVRYPYSGLVSSDFSSKTLEHNVEVNKLPPGQPTALLNGNVMRWLNLETFENWEGRFRVCRSALEGPHNSMHLAIGGFDVPNGGNFNVYPFANGDMGENDTAAFDPVFFFHHCFIDYMFWKWQDIHNKSKQLDIIPDLKGAKGLTLDTPLEPFTKEEFAPGDSRPLTSNDVTNTANLGYDYPRPEFDSILPGPDLREGPKITATGINRARIRGSFVVSTWAKGKNGEPDILLDTKSVLSRWNVESCENCQNHLDVKSHRKLYGFSDEEALDTDFYALIHTRDNPQGIDTIEGNKIQTEIGTAQ